LREALARMQASLAARPAGNVTPLREGRPAGWPLRDRHDSRTREGAARRRPFLPTRETWWRVRDLKATTPEMYATSRAPPCRPRQIPAGHATQPQPARPPVPLPSPRVQRHGWVRPTAPETRSPFKGAPESQRGAGPKAGALGGRAESPATAPWHLSWSLRPPERVGRPPPSLTPAAGSQCPVRVGRPGTEATEATKGGDGAPASR
jgi:hypothetical protein